MKIQMVVLANAEEPRGRLLAGIRLENGVQSTQNGKPQWLRLRVRKDKTYIPKALVIDIRPQDVISFDALDFDPKDVEGWVVIDPQSLTINGMMSLIDFDFCKMCTDGCAEMLMEKSFDVEKQALCFILGCDCRVVTPSNNGSKGKGEQQLRFGYQGTIYHLPLSDPQLREAIVQIPDLLDDRQSLQLLLAGGEGRHVQRGSPRVLTVLY